MSWWLIGWPGQEVRFSPYLVIGFIGRSLMTGVTLPGHVELVGPPCRSPKQGVGTGLRTYSCGWLCHHWRQLIMTAT